MFNWKDYAEGIITAAFERNDSKRSKAPQADKLKQMREYYQRSKKPKCKTQHST